MIKNKRLQNVELSGFIKGNLWMGGDGIKQFRETFTRQEWNGLTPALETLVNDSDFDGCKIVMLRFVITYGIGRPGWLITKIHYANLTNQVYKRYSEILESDSIIRDYLIGEY